MKTQKFSDLGWLQNKLRETKTTKFAAIGGEPSTGFESSFASLAYVYIQDKAPGLIDYLVGFQLVDTNEENTKGVGIFGFKVNGSWLYIPVFWLAGDVKGHELLYLKKQDLFVPLKENWVNYVINQKSSDIGVPSALGERELGLAVPDMETLKTPPIEKYSCANRAKPWAKAAFAAFDSWLIPPAKHSKFASWDMDLFSALSHSLALTQAAIKYSSICPSVKRGFDTFYGKDFLKSCLTELKKKAQAQESVLPSVVVRTGIGLSKAAEEQPKVEILTDVDMTEKTVVDIPGLSKEDRTKLLRDGFLVRDSRNGEETSRAYSYQINTSLSNPTQTGVYDVLTKSDNFERCLVIVNPKGSKSKRGCVVIRLSDKQKNNCTVKDVFIRPSNGASDYNTAYKTFFESLPSPGKLSEDAKYVVLSDKGNATTIFEVTTDNGDDSYFVDFDDYFPKADGQLSDYSSIDDVYVDTLVVNKHKGADLTSVGNRLLVSPDCKIFTVSEPKNCESCGKSRINCTCSYFRCKSDRQRLVLGTESDVRLKLIEKTSELKIWHDSHEVVINQNRMAKKAGLFHLICHHGFTERDATRMIKESERLGGNRYRVKYAAPYPGQYETLQGPGMPYFPELGAGGYSEQMGGVMTSVPDQQDITIPELAAAPGADEMMDSMPPEQMAQVAQQATQTGQKEVFDTAIIGSLVNAVRQDSVVDRYLGDLVKGLDRLGRLLFLFYWHNEDFADRFGQSDMPELEDSLRNAFEGLGDLVLYLKQKNVNTMDFGTGAGEPSLENIDN